jgi:hypothetical protein
MNTKDIKRNSRARPGFVRGSWRDRVDPAFALYWSLRKKNEALPKITDEKKAEQQFRDWRKEFSAASRAFNQAVKRIKEPIGAKIQAAVEKKLDTEGPLVILSVPKGQELTIYPENPESSGFFRKIVFLKYGITFSELVWQIDIEKNDAAHRKLMAVHRDYWRLLSGRSLPRDFKLKFSMDHFDILTSGLDFGLEKLAPEELASCLNEICPCGQKHSDEYIKKLRTRIKRACQRIIEDGSSRES